MFEIEISSDAPHFNQEHHLFGCTYLLEFAWIDIEEMWMMHLYDGHEKPIALGLKVGAGWPILLDETINMVLWLIPKVPNAILNAATLQRDFVVVAHELV